SVLGKDRSYLFLYPKEKIEKIKCELFSNYILRRVKREPVAYITGEKEFWSIPFMVTKDTLIPRPDTEILVQSVLTHIRDKNFQVNEIIKILDVGTGSGNLSVSLASETDNRVQIFSIDISCKALEVAKKNIISSGYRASCKCILKFQITFPLHIFRGFFKKLKAKFPHIHLFLWF
ncbi:MAG: peptide chain release factor N(5)-glutamine methyltransferase, partial [Ignavibacteriae bacterium]|nr:peptide chain release factor N(5)-glutamine methyltransferase [Ignavibacteriota bacterium]